MNEELRCINVLIRKIKYSDCKQSPVTVYHQKMLSTLENPGQVKIGSVAVIETVRNRIQINPKRKRNQAIAAPPGLDQVSKRRMPRSTKNDLQFKAWDRYTRPRACLLTLLVKGIRLKRNVPLQLKIGCRPLGIFIAESSKRSKYL